MNKTDISNNSENELSVIIGMELFFDRLSHEAVEQLQFDFGDKVKIENKKASMHYLFEKPRQVETEHLSMSIFALVEHMKIYCEKKSYQMVRMDISTCSCADFERAVVTGRKHTLNKFQVRIVSD